LYVARCRLLVRAEKGREFASLRRKREFSVPPNSSSRSAPIMSSRTPIPSSRSAPIRDPLLRTASDGRIRGKRSENRGVKIRISLSSSRPLSSSRAPLVFTKTLDAERRNEELGRSAPEPLLTLFPRTGFHALTTSDLSPLSPQAIRLFRR